MAKKIDFEDMHIEQLIAPDAFKRLKEGTLNAKKKKEKPEPTGVDRAAAKLKKAKKKEQKQQNNGVVQISVN